MLEMHPEYEDYYFNIEKIIIARVGMEIGGKMHTARSTGRGADGPHCGGIYIHMRGNEYAGIPYRRESQYNGPGGGGGRDRMRAGDHPPYLRKYPADHCTASSWVRTLCS